MSKHASPTVVGTFVVAALALAVAAVVILGGARFFHETERFVVFFEDSVNGLRVGAPVKFRGIEIGAVKDVRVNMAGAVRDPAHIRIAVIIELDIDRLTAGGVSGLDFHDRAQVRKLVDAGLRAELDTESLVTGVRYIALDVRPKAPANLVNDPNVKYAEIPSVRGALAGLPDKVDRVLTRLAEVDFEAIGHSLQATVDDAHALLGSQDLKNTVHGLDELTQHVNRTVGDLDQAVRGLTPAVTEIGQAAKSTGRMVAPDSTFGTQLGQALTELSAAARAIRRLAEHIDRDPGSLLRGGQQ